MNNPDRWVGELLNRALDLSETQRNAMWDDFADRAAREAVQWRAFATCLAAAARLSIIAMRLWEGKR